MTAVSEKTQKERLLEMFKEKHLISNYELRSMPRAIFQFPVRILELRRDGHDIQGFFDSDDKRKYWYKYTPKAPVQMELPTPPASNPQDRLL